MDSQWQVDGCGVFERRKSFQFSEFREAAQGASLDQLLPF
jgi:hypothetical protein